MDAAIGDQPFQGKPGHLAAHRVEAGDDHGLRGVVDDQVDAGGRLDGADVAPFAADDPSLHLIGRQRHHTDGLLGHIVAGIALDGQGEDVLRLLVGNLPGLVLDLLDAPGSVVARLALHHRQQLLLGVFGRQPGDLLKLPALLFNQAIDLRVALLEGPVALEQLLVAALQLLVTGIELLNLAIEVLFLLHQALFQPLQFTTQLADLVLPFVLGLEHDVLGLDLGFLANRVGFLANRVSFLANCVGFPAGIFELPRRTTFGIDQFRPGSFAAQQGTQETPGNQTNQHDQQNNFYLQHSAPPRRGMIYRPAVMPAGKWSRRCSVTNCVNRQSWLSTGNSATT